MFKPTYLYIKTHNKTGLRYFGKTITKNPHSYRGSGKRWLNHLKYHGNDVVTEVIGFFEDESSCRSVALEFSSVNNIVEDDSWANLEVEDGIQGGFGRIGPHNGQFGKRWITNGVDNTRILKTDPIPDGWRSGRTVPKTWGENLSKKLKGRSHKELFGEEYAAKRSLQKRELMIGNKRAVGRSTYRREISKAL